MTVYFDVREMAAAAFDAAVNLANGKDPGATGTENNGLIDVPVLGFPATAITADNWQLPIDEGYLSMSYVQ
jgi:ABC-type xylose transport system substrate-binding protein